ncbi:MAG: hypothetical protein ACR2F2_13100 [Pyrinomonadaceae bacterium]
MSEPREPKKTIEPKNWAEFLEGFSARNNNRRARFNIFRGGEAQEEDQEAHLEDVKLVANGDAKNVEIIRIDRANSTADKINDVITNVRGIAVQYDTDKSEDVLEITDDQNTLISLRMESKVDGAS